MRSARAEGAAAEGLNGTEAELPSAEGSEGATEAAAAVPTDETPREGGRRRGRGRDRNRREAREEEGGAPAEGEAVAVDAEPGPEIAVDAAETPVEGTAAEPVATEASVLAVAAPAPVQPEPAPAPAAAAAALPTTPVPARPAAPTLQRFELPTDELAAIASGAGLQWVNSDADKIRAVQAEMAAEPRPIHVPREPRPPVVIDEGPLVLVETKKDLSQMKLPFEQQQRPPGA